ncbi:hypothetical protein OsJ_03404 [Oryza sativa Japonica Group]|uniref:Uncharacterized protein n=1 Tax=Oryza sativa subsp. japonica TaxID=39947 RepID=B9EZL7_ORYSJ|nr:hypothetical protein OsJ_03404 [Oryza sativa Japonica Group]
MMEVAARSSSSLSLSISTRLASGYFADTDGVGRAASSPDKGDVEKPLQEEEWSDDAAATAMMEVAARSSSSLSLSISTRLASGYFADTDGVGRAASSPDKGDVEKPLQEDE